MPGQWQGCAVQTAKLLVAALAGALVVVAWVSFTSSHPHNHARPAFHRASDRTTVLLETAPGGRKSLQPQVRDAAPSSHPAWEWNSYFDERRLQAYNPWDHTAEDICSLKPDAATKPPQRIPNIIHFIFGLKEDFGDKPFNFVHYTAVVSAHLRAHADAIYLHHIHEPRGEWWDGCKHLVTLVKSQRTEFIYGHQLKNTAHQADIIRLEVLYEYGGIYLDIDTLVLQPFDALLHHDMVMGYELDADYGIGNSVILAAPESKFIERWLSTYAAFDSEQWAQHSIEVPRRLALEHPSEICVMPAFSFHYPMAWTATGQNTLFEELTSEQESEVLIDNVALDGHVYHGLVPGQYALHTAETGSWKEYFHEYNLTSLPDKHTRMGMLMRDIFEDVSRSPAAEAAAAEAAEAVVANSQQ